MKPWSVYVLECQSGRLYTGVAVDPRKRLLAHASGKGALFTRADPPRRCLTVRQFPDQSSALKEEHRIKQLSRTEKLDLITQWQREGCHGFDLPT